MRYYEDDLFYVADNYDDLEVLENDIINKKGWFTYKGQFIIQKFSTKDDFVRLFIVSMDTMKFIADYFHNSGHYKYINIYDIMFPDTKHEPLLNWNTKNIMPLDEAIIEIEKWDQKLTRQRLNRKYCQKCGVEYDDMYDEEHYCDDMYFYYTSEEERQKLLNGEDDDDEEDFCYLSDEELSAEELQRLLGKDDGE